MSSVAVLTLLFDLFFREDHTCLSTLVSESLIHSKRRSALKHFKLLVIRDLCFPVRHLLRGDRSV